VTALVIEAIQKTLSAVAFAERALIGHLGAARGYGDDAGNFHGIAFLAQYLIDLSFAMHGVPPDYFFEVVNLAPGDFMPQ
jgi:hypothetical protein